MNREMHHLQNTGNVIVIPTRYLGKQAAKTITKLNSVKQLHCKSWVATNHLKAEIR